MNKETRNELSDYGIYQSQNEFPSKWDVFPITRIEVDLRLAKTKHDLISIIALAFRGKPARFHLKNISEAVFEAPNFDEAFVATKRYVVVTHAPKILLS